MGPSAAAGELVAVDCGAGIGRITQGLLLQFCKEVDLVEPLVRRPDTLRTGP